MPVVSISISTSMLTSRLPQSLLTSIHQSHPGWRMWCPALNFSSPWTSLPFLQPLWFRYNSAVLAAHSLGSVLGFIPGLLQAHCSLSSWLSLLFLSLSFLSSHGQVSSDGHVQSGLFQVPLAVFSLISTIKTFSEEWLCPYFQSVTISIKTGLILIFLLLFPVA